MNIAAYREAVGQKRVVARVKGIVAYKGRFLPNKIG